MIVKTGLAIVVFVALAAILLALTMPAAAQGPMTVPPSSAGGSPATNVTKAGGNVTAAGTNVSKAGPTKAAPALGAGETPAIVSGSRYACGIYNQPAGNVQGMPYGMGTGMPMGFRHESIQGSMDVRLFPF